MFFMKKLLSFEAASAGDSDVRVLSPGSHCGNVDKIRQNTHIRVSGRCRPENSKVFTKITSFPDAQRPETLMCVFVLLDLPEGISTKMANFQLNNTHMRISGL